MKLHGGPPGIDMRVVRFVTLAYGLAWAIWLVPMAAMAGAYEFNDAFFPFLVAGSFSPAVAAIVCKFKDEKWEGVKGLLQQACRVRFSMKAYAYALLMLPVLAALAYALLGIRAANPEESTLLYVTMVAAPINGLLGLVTSVGPLGEELGWRGYLQPILSQRRNDVAAAVAMGLIWAFWHLPLFLFPEWRSGLDFPTFLLLYPLSAVMLSFIMTKLWRWSNRSVFLAMWFHSLVNSLLGLMTTDAEVFDFAGQSSVSVYVLILGILMVCCVLCEMASGASHGIPRRKVDSRSPN